MYTKKMYSKIRQCRPSPGQGTFVFIKWKRTSPAQLPLSDSPSMAGRAGPARVGSLWPPMGNRDLGGTTAHFSLIKLKRSFSFRRIKNLGWFSAELRVLPGELSPSLTQWITKSVCDSDPTITTGPAPCNASGKELSQMSPLLHVKSPVQSLSRSQKQLDSQIRFWMNKI